MGFGGECHHVSVLAYSPAEHAAVVVPYESVAFEHDTCWRISLGSQRCWIPRAEHILHIADVGCFFGCQDRLVGMAVTKGGLATRQVDGRSILVGAVLLIYYLDQINDG